MLVKARQLAAAGDLPGARQTLEQLLKKSPRELPALKLLAQICLQLADKAAAASALRAAATLAVSLEIQGTLGSLLTDLGEPDALDVCRFAVEQWPDNAALHYNLGNAYVALKRLEEASLAFAQALNLKADFVLAASNLGAVYHRLKRDEQAVSTLQKAVALDGRYAPARLNLALSLASLGQVSLALQHFDQSLSLRPGHVETVVEYTHVLMASGGHAKAFDLLQGALRTDAHNALLWFSLGQLFADGRKYEPAAQAYRVCLEIDPTHAQAALKLGTVLVSDKKPQEALIFLDKARLLDPSLSEVSAQLLTAYRQLAVWTHDQALTSQVISQARDNPPTIQLLSLFNISDDAALARDAVCAYVAALNCPLRARPALKPRGLKPRVGYLSPDFGEHPVGYSIVEVLERHNRDRFTIIGLSLSTAHSTPMAQRIVNACDEFVELGGRDDSQALKALRDADLDLLVDLGGHTAGTRARLLAERPAAVQLSYLGFPGTSGAPWMDALIADEVVVPESFNEFYTERVLRVSRSFFPTDTTQRLADPGTRAFNGLPEGRVILASFVAAARISPMLFASWMRILQAVDGAVLWLQGNATIGAQLRAEAARAGVDPHRLIFAARVAERSEHLARQAHADLFLDVFPYNAHSTARDALWAGVPVLTRRGQSFASRVAASLVSAAGLSELITTDLSQYENLAIRLASDPAQLAALKAQLADHRHQLFDTPYLVAELEKAYMTLLDS